MRKNQVKGLIHDLLNLRDWQNPLDKSMLNKNAEVDLLTGEILGTDDNWIIEFFKEKIKWFQERINKLGGIKDFQKAKIFLIGNKEKVEIIFKNESFSDEIVWGRYLEEMKERFESYR